MRENIKRNSKKIETKRGNLISRKPKKRFSQTKNSPMDHILHLQRTMGNRAVARLIKTGAIQAKLKIGKPNDIYEKEADSVANKVMSMPEVKQSSAQRKSTCPECPEKEGIQTKPLAEQITPLIQRQAEEEEEVQPKIQRQATEEEEEPVQTKLIQRQASPGEEEEVQTKLQRQAEEEEEEPVQAKLLQRQEAEEEEEPVQTKLLQRQGTEEEEESVQAKSVQRQESEEEEVAQAKIQRQAEEEEETAQAKASPGNTPEVTPNIESNINSMKGGGQTLSESTRSFFEPRFGTDFSQVRVHTDGKAGKIARSINAKAFTTGKDIVFNSGQYSPGTSSGRRLLAHELTHVVQQDQGISINKKGLKYENIYFQPPRIKSTNVRSISKSQNSIIIQRHPALQALIRLGQAAWPILLRAGNAVVRFFTVNGPRAWRYMVQLAQPLAQRLWEFLRNPLFPRIVRRALTALRGNPNTIHHIFYSRNAIENHNWRLTGLSQSGNINLIGETLKRNLSNIQIGIPFEVSSRFGEFIVTVRGMLLQNGTLRVSTAFVNK